MRRHLLALILLTSSCATNSEPFHAWAISMTDTDVQACRTKGQPVQEQWCDGEPFGTGSKDHFGYFDEVVFKTQKKYGVKVLLAPQIRLTSNDRGHCALLQAYLPKGCSR